MPGHEGAPQSHPLPEQQPADSTAEQQPLPPSPEEAAEIAADEHNREVDVELLGRSFTVRRTLNKSVTEVISRKHQYSANIKNALSTPKNRYLEMRYLSAQEKFNRKQDKAENARFFKRYRQNVANDARRKMEGRKTKLDRHTGVMQGRLDNAKSVRDRHETIDRNKIKGYIDRKSLAKSRKEIRVMRREMRDNGKSRLETTRIIGGLSIEQRKRIGEASLRVEKAEQKRSVTINEKSRTQYQQNTAKEQIKTGGENLETMRTERAAAIANIIKNTSNRESLLEKIQSIRNKLETGLDHDDAMSQDEIAQRQLDDPLYNPGADAQPTEINADGRELLQTQLLAAETELAGLNKIIDSTQKTITKLNTSIDRVERGIATNEEKVSVYGEKLSDYDKKIAEHNAEIQRLKEERTAIIEQGLGGTIDQTSTQPQPSNGPTQQTSTPVAASPSAAGAEVISLDDHRPSSAPNTQQPAA